MQGDKLKGHLAIAAAYVIFGLNIVFCKDIATSGTVSPYVLFTLRALGASLLFWLLSAFLPKEKVERKDFPKIAAASLIGLFVPQMTFLMAITMSSAIDTALIGTLGPIFTMFFAFFFLKEPITGKKAGGVALSFAGILLLIFNSVHQGGAVSTSPLGVALLLLNSLSFSLYLGLFRPLISKYSVVTFMKWSFLVSLVVSLPVSARDLLMADFTAIPVNVRWEIAYLIFFATVVAYYLIPYGQKFIRPTLVSIYSYLQPIIAAIVSILAGMDSLSWQKMLAAALVVGGVVLVGKSRSAHAKEG
ncbi:MAG: EamA family transporter [Bacteroidales bacterium]|nr:EamA family transporter [Bacteroidales bacterium]